LQQFDRGPKRGLRTSLIGVLSVAAALAAAPVALANTTKSTNWAGYAVHRDGVSFRQVSGTWIQPGATCIKGQPSYSAAWVGLGGYDPTSTALEQIGTEVDCAPGGKVTSSAWYELVPAPSRTISLSVAPGDVMHATVTVTGHRVVVDLDNLTQHHRFHKAFDATSIDVSSAEWIVEAPSQCVSQFACQALPLADFGSVTFASATAATTTGPSGAIVDSHWGRTRIRLTPGNQGVILARNTSDATGAAAPSPLRAGGSAFDVIYATASTQTPQQGFARKSHLRAAGYLQH
jgi:peptidase A4-like protein